MKFFLLIIPFFLTISYEVFSKGNNIEERMTIDIECPLYSENKFGSINSELLYQSGLIRSIETFKCKNLKEAIRFFQEAAYRGHTRAQYKLCDVQAHMEKGLIAIQWCYVASQRGNIDAIRKLKFFKESFDSKIYEKGIKKGILLSAKIDSGTAGSDLRNSLK